jgi:hypothetical protein
MIFPIKTDSAQFYGKNWLAASYNTCKMHQWYCWEQNIALQRRMCCGGGRGMLEEYSGENNPAPQFGNRGWGNP